MKSEIKERIEQIQRGEVPEGYKKTKLGILPNDWTSTTLGECLEKVEKPVAMEPDKLYTQIGIRSHGKGLFYKEPVTGESLGNKSVYWIEPDCFILNIVFAWEQAIGKTTHSEEGMIGSHRFPMYRPVNNLVDIDYLICYLLTKRGASILDAASPGGAGRNRTLGQDRFMKSKIVLPTLAEQTKIAEILAAQDKVIELQECKIDELKRLKKYYLSKMFPKHGSKVPELRFSGFTGDWEQRKLGEMGSTYTGLSGKTKEDFGHGAGKFVTYMNVFLNPISDPARTENVEVDASQNEVHYGDVLFTTSSETPEEVGMSSVWLENSENTYLNSFCFGYRPTEKIDPHYMAYMLRSEAVRKKIVYLAQGISRYNISKNGVMQIEVPLPDLTEQKLLGEHFRNLDNLITLHQRKLEEMKSKKKALMQLLLTGIVRVNV